jgi:2-succinyl-5-enolpyruvyl-6-hydroxy-3-cyclohexene-1-carboxylate synthase
MPIRDFNRFSKTEHPWIRSGVNRGASGIDGVLATAAGWTYASQNPAILVIGDVATTHDIGSFLQISQRKTSIPLLVCIINNGGGGIFSFLPISHEQDIFESHFATAHKTDFTSIMKSMNIPTTAITNIQRLKKELTQFFTNPRFSVLELCTNRQENHKEHKDLQTSITQALSQHLSATP